MSEKQIILSSHARFEMARRGITASEVTGAVRRPGQIIPSVKGREIRQSIIGIRRNLLLRVVVRNTSTAYHVVTAYKTSKLAKYWIQS